MVSKLLVSNIIRYAIHDGTGIRTTVFLKGCNLHCPWCANPETIRRDNQFWFDDTKCVGTKDNCIFSTHCSRSLAKRYAGKTTTDSMDIICPCNALIPVAKEYTQDELLQLIRKDREFWGDSGGVTFSGGEPLLQLEELVPLLEELKSKHISIAFETAGCVETSIFSKMLRFADQVYLDMKSNLSEEARLVTGADMSVYYENMNALDQSSVCYTIRIPLNRPYTFKEQNLNEIISVLASLKRKKVEIFACHKLGKRKYEKLGIESAMNHYEPVSEQELEEVKKQMTENGIPVSILKL